MNSEPEQELKQRLQQIEAELNSPADVPAVSQPQQPVVVTTTNNAQTIPLVLKQFVNWFKSLPGIGKLVVVSVAAVLGFAILRAVLQLVAALFSLAVLAVLLYFAYRFVVARTSERD